MVGGEAEPFQPGAERFIDLDEFERQPFRCPLPSGHEQDLKPMGIDPAHVLNGDLHGHVARPEKEGDKRILTVAVARGF